MSTCKNNLYKSYEIVGENEYCRSSNKTWKLFKRFLLFALCLFFVMLLIIFVGIPLTFKYSNNMRLMFIFRNTADLPEETNYSDFRAFGFEGARNFYLYNKGSKLGVWHILPSDMVSNDLSEAKFENNLKEKPEVILYNHGNSGSRGTSYRIHLYKILRKKYHVIIYDYRGFGDSNGEPPTKEEDVVDDGIFMTRWLVRKLPPEAKLILWGHSMGSSVTLSTTKTLKKENIIPTAIILESTFHNGREMVSQTPLLQNFRFLPWFDACFLDPLVQHNGRFQNNEYIVDADCPILILHSEDDRTISYKLAEKSHMKLEKWTEQGWTQLPLLPPQKDVCRSSLNSPLMRDMWITWSRMTNVAEPEKCPIPPGNYSMKEGLIDMSLVKRIPFWQGKFRAFMTEYFQRVDNKIYCLEVNFESKEVV